MPPKHTSHCYYDTSNISLSEPPHSNRSYAQASLMSLALLSLSVLFNPWPWAFKDFSGMSQLIMKLIKGIIRTKSPSMALFRSFHTLCWWHNHVNWMCFCDFCRKAHNASARGMSLCQFKTIFKIIVSLEGSCGCGVPAEELTCP